MKYSKPLGYISHYSAACHWNIPFLDSTLNESYINLRKEGNIDITASDPMMHYKKKGRIDHFCKMDLPRDAVVKYGNDLIASPKLVFLELANELDIHRLILLGLQMCSHPVGKSNMAVTTKRRIDSFLKRTPGVIGHRNAVRAIKYIENGSASLMESIAFMILTLPNLYGGFGLKGARFNYEIPLEEKAKRQLRQKRCFADLYYPKAKLAVEYDSYAYHNSPSSQGKDGARAVALENQGIKVMRFVTTQLYNKKLFLEFALNLSSNLGKHMRIRTDKFYKAHRNLRKLLPSK